MKANQSFLKEIRESRTFAKSRRTSFTWEKTLATPIIDESLPSAKLARTPVAKPMKAPLPTSDLPLTSTGHIDNVELKSDLTSQLKSQRRR